MYKPFFSIVTASYNYGETIEKTILSIKEQTFRDVEHIIVDGGSDDNTAQIVANHLDDYHLNWFSEPDEGISDAMNKGIKKSRGRYIIVIQADDYLISKDILQKVYVLLMNEEYSLYSFPICYKDTQGEMRVFGPSKYYKYYYKLKNCFRSQGTFIHRCVFSQIGYFRTELSINMDYDLYYRAMKAGVSVMIGDLPVSIMGRYGISSRKEDAPLRIAHEFQVHQDNEQSRFWRFIQKVYQKLYLPYKFGILGSRREG